MFFWLFFLACSLNCDSFPLYNRADEAPGDYHLGGHPQSTPGNALPTNHGRAGASVEASDSASSSPPPACRQCGKGFLPLWRPRHRCRTCGDHVCGPCSSHKLVTAASPFVPRRACDRCYDGALDG